MSVVPPTAAAVPVLRLNDSNVVRPAAAAALATVTAEEKPLEKSTGSVCSLETGAAASCPLLLPLPQLNVNCVREATVAEEVETTALDNDVAGLK